MSSIPPERRAEMDRLGLLALGVGVGALVVCLVGAFFSPVQFFRAYLASYLFYLGLAHGCMVILLVYHLTGGAWGFLIRRFLEAGMRTMPLLAVLFIPIAFGVHDLYLWAQPLDGRPPPVNPNQHVYLNTGFFWLRAAVYFVLWVAIAYFMSVWSRGQDRTGDPRYAAYMENLAGPALVVFGVTITFASIDWVMSLQPGFRSTIFGPLFATGEILSAMALALIVLGWLVGRPPLSDVISVEAMNDLGNLQFTFLVIWGYMGYFQFMLIWIADLPYDVSWYDARSYGGWQWVGAVLAVLQFGVPFFLLLLRDVKRNPRALAQVAALVLGMHLVYQYFQVMPAWKDTPLGQHWMDFLTPFAVGGPWLAYFLWQLKQYPVLPTHDANQAGAVHLHALDLEQAARRQEVQHHG